jgi:hypothetical protein
MVAEPTRPETAYLHDVGIRFIATGVRLYFGAGEPWSGGSNVPRVIYSLRPEVGELTLSSGESTQEMPITLAVTNQKPDADGGLGAIYYMGPYVAETYSHPAHLAIEINVAADEFGELIALARRGRFPNSIGIRVRGLKLSDAGGAEWDTADKAIQKRAVSHIDFSFPLGGEAIEEAAIESGRPREQPLTVEIVEELRTQLRKLGNWAGWILTVLVVILAFIVFRGH